eukprot:m.7095 g.7095  ORF g.7095 m.7095 type:complete len:283 (+) comp3911_c0_seq2:3061-3909(+)
MRDVTTVRVCELVFTLLSIATAVGGNSTSTTGSPPLTTTLTSTTSTINASDLIRDDTYTDPDPDNLAIKLIVPLMAFGLFFAFACCAIYRPADCADLRRDLQRECVCSFCRKRTYRTPTRAQIEERRVSAIALRRQRDLNELLGGAGFNAIVDGLDDGPIEAEQLDVQDDARRAAAIAIGNAAVAPAEVGEAAAQGEFEMEHGPLEDFRSPEELDPERAVARPEHALLAPLLALPDQPILQDSDAELESVRVESDRLLISPDPDHNSGDPASAVTQTDESTV